jgi:hypothetical protein
MSLTTCIKKAGAALSAADKSAIVKLARKYRSEGMKPDDAGRAAIREQISEVKSLLKQAIENPVSVDTFVEPVQKTAEPVQVKPVKRRIATSVRGSAALGQVSAQLGGIGQKLLSDLSQRVARSRTDKKTGKATPYIAWDNPPHAGFGPLFRKGGTEDMGEIARVLSAEGFIAPGLYESDPLAAAQEAERIIKGELAKGGSTLRIGDAESVEAEMRAARDAAMDDSLPDNLFDGLDDADLESSGYADASQEVKDATERLMADAENFGLDIEALREDAAKATEGESEDEYHAALQAATRSALQTVRKDGKENGGPDASTTRAGNQDRSQVDGGEEPQGLTSPTPQSLAEADRRKRDADAADAREQKRLADKAKADSEVSEFALTGSDRQADVGAAAGQGDIFSPDATQPRPAQLIEMRKREAVLKKLKECIAS